MTAGRKTDETASFERSFKSFEMTDISPILPKTEWQGLASMEVPKPTADEVASWLHILLDPEMDREPDEFYIEKHVLQKHRQKVPEYSLAARSWPMSATEHWDTVGPLVRQLLSRRFNFMQWVLEFARQTYPDIYGPQATPNDAILDLTDILYDGTFSPLHVSAALGLEPMCLELLEQPCPSGVSPHKRAASPLLCALAGPQIFTCGTSTQKWYDEAPAKYPSLYLEGVPCSSYQELHLHYPKLHCRLRVIERLLRLHREKRVLYETTGGKGCLLMTLAFRATVLTRNAFILKEALEGGGDARTVTDLINRDAFSSYERCPDKSLVAGVLNSILDLVLAPSKLNLAERERQGLIDAIRASFILVGGIHIRSGTVDITDSEFQEALEDAFFDDSLICFKRLMHHPSFDANAPSPTGLADGTILHHAVSDSQVELADLIVEAGGNLDARDHKGRTPLLLCNDTETLAMLVKEHGARTTSVDHEGLNIWHYAAATSDVPLIMWLAGHDARKSENLTAVTKANATPLDMALKYGLESHDKLEPEDKRRMDMAIVVQVLLSNNAPHADEIGGMTALRAIAKIVRSQPRPAGSNRGQGSTLSWF